MEPYPIKRHINISFPASTLLGVVLIILKALGYINWSWWIVLLPIYVPVILWLVVAAIMFACVVAYNIERKQRRIL